MEKGKFISHFFASILLRILTFSYAGAYKYHTLKPIENIRDHQNYERVVLKDDLIKALADFRQTKAEEISFVAKAVCKNLLNSSGFKL
jgi:hypothetical protein